MKPAYSNPSSPCGCRFESYLRSCRLLGERELVAQKAEECRSLCRKIEEIPGPREDFVDAVMARASVIVIPGTRHCSPSARAYFSELASPYRGAFTGHDAADALLQLREFLLKNWVEVVSQMALAMKGERFLNAGGGRDE